MRGDRLLVGKGNFLRQFQPNPQLRVKLLVPSRLHADVLIYLSK
jgi:hypothetical protein